MKHSIKRIIAVCTLALVVASSSLAAFAAANDGAATRRGSDSSEASQKAHNGKNSVHVDVFAVAASVLGQTTDEVNAIVKDGGKIGDLLIAANKVDAFKTAYLAELKTKLDAAVTAGTLTQAQADKKYAAKKETMDAYDGTASLNGEKSKGGAKTKSGVRVDVLSVAASVLGKTTDEIKDAVKDGKVGDLLIAAGKVDAFKTAYLTELKTKLDAAVSAGTLTQAQADEKYAAGKAKMDAYDGTTHLCGGKDSHKARAGRDAKSAELPDSVV